MQEDRLDTIDDSRFDVVICGAGLAGLTLARQLHQEHPGKRVLLLDKTRRPFGDAAHKVGESSVEVGAGYFEKLGLRDYLREDHLVKFGLRFFPGGGHLPLEQRLEIGPMQEPIVPSYQIDRGRFEQDLRGFVEQDDTTLVEGATVREVDLGPGEQPHDVRFEVDDPRSGSVRSVTVQCRWLVDATGRNALLRRRLKLTRGNRHPANAGWFRVRGKVDINDLVPQSARAWHEPETAKDRWRSTNHLMGEGYWAWIIPLSSGNTSIGLVVHDEVHGFDCVRSLDRVKAFLAEHEPVLARALEAFEVMDFLCLRNYSHNVGRSFSPDRWALVGEAGAFVDPLYSPGSDFIAYANSFASELIKVDDEGGDLETRCRDLNLQYRALISGNVDIFRDAAPVYDHPRAMLAKVYWDNFSYWSFPCQFFLQGIYRLGTREAAPFVSVGQRFVELSSYVQALLREWALAAPEEPEPGFIAMPKFPSVVVDAHLALQDQMTPDATLAYMRQRAAEAEEMAGELLIRVFGEVGPELAQQIAAKLELSRWQLPVDPGRLAVEKEVGLARRRVLSPIARDVERSLGKPRRRGSEAELARALAPLLRTSQAVPIASVPGE